MCEISKAIAIICAQGLKVEATRPNTFTKSKYANYEDVMTVLSPALKEHKLSISFEPSKRNMVLVVSKVDNEMRNSYEIELPGEYESAQKVGSSMTYMKRYSVVNLFNMLVAEDDDDGNEASNKSKEKPKFDQKVKDIVMRLTSSKDINSFYQNNKSTYWEGGFREFCKDHYKKIVEAEKKVNEKMKNGGKSNSNK